MDAPDIRLIPADGPEWLDGVRDIFREYAGSLEVDLAFQGSTRNSPRCRTVRGARGPADAGAGGRRHRGSGAFAPLRDADYPNACENETPLRPPGLPPLRLGRIIAQALLDDARRAGYSTMLLDTLDDMEAARELYATLGFREIPPYYFNPIPGAHYLKADLD